MSQEKLEKAARVALGIGLIVMAGAFAVVDMGNNYDFGAKRSEGLGRLFALAAIGLVIVPMAAEAAKEWTRILAFLALVCFGVSFMAGISNHLNAQAEHTLAAQDANARYEDARKALARAEEELRIARAERDAIAELGAADDLQRQHDEAKAARDAEVNDERRGKRCGTACRDAEALMKALAPRITDARSKEAARQRVREAETKLNAARDVAPDGRHADGREAEVIASFVGAPAPVIAAIWEMLLSLLATLGPIVGAMVSGFGFRMLRPVAAEPARTTRPARPSAIVEAKARVVRGATNTPPPPPKAGLPGFIEACRPGPVIPQKDVAAALARWWHATGQEGDIPAPRTLGLALVGAGFERTTQGRNKVPHYAIQLPPIAPTLAMTGSD